MKAKAAVKIKGVARVKKYNMGKIPDIDEPDEILENSFNLTEAETKEFLTGNANKVIERRQI